MLVDGMDMVILDSPLPLVDLFTGAEAAGCDLVVTDCPPKELEKLAGPDYPVSEDSGVALLYVAAREQLASLRLPVQIPCDFICVDASDEECAARIRRLLWPGEESGGGEFIRQGPLTLNLATYQVKIDGDPVDFTYLEYALLAFLITHPGRTYSRDALLNRVWDFDYYGGSRTVDVHVRRIRAKLGPDLAQYLKTVRGVGYLWSY